MAIKKKADDLKTLLPEQVIETSQGPVTLRPFKFKDFNKALNYVGKYVSVFTESEDTYQVIKALIMDGAEETLTDIANLIALASDCTIEHLEEMGYDEVTSLLMSVIEQNIDFFNRLAGRLNKKSGEAKTPEALPSPKPETDGEVLSAA